MDIDKLLLETNKLFEDSESLLTDLDGVAIELERVHEIAIHTEDILDDLDRQFEQSTGLTEGDINFLFVAVALQCIRIYAVNKFTKMENAGKGNKKENTLHDIQDKIFDKFNSDVDDIARPYYAPLNQIIGDYKVPYDATAFLSEKHDCFKGANHRFGTLGHDPLLGLFFGTINVLTNTITCVNKPIIDTYHVVYNENFGAPKIGKAAPTAIALAKSVERLNGDIESVVAALIKVVIHTGTDMFTPCGIQLPGANLVLSRKNTEELTKIISTGDIVKIGASYGIAELINTMISIFHQLTYDDTKCSSRNLYAVRTKKIILYSNMIATGSNVIWVGANVNAGNTKAIKDLDIAGLIIIIQKLLHDKKFIAQVKDEFIYGTYYNMIWNEDDY